MQNKSLEYIILFVVTFLFFLNDVYIWSSFGIGMFCFFCVSFFNNLGKKIDIRDLISILSFLQWVVGPYLAYQYYKSSIDDYHMITDESLYMAFVVPAASFFTLGLYLPIVKTKFDLDLVLKKNEAKVHEYKNLDLILILSGFIMSFLWTKLPVQLRFIGFLFANLQYIGLFFMLINKQRKRRKLFLILTIIFLAITALTSGFFHDMLLWFGFIFLFIAFIQKFNFLKKGLIIIALLGSIIILQTVKMQFREIIWKQASLKSFEKTEIFYSLASENIQNEFITSQSNIDNLIQRINQGWIISRVMNWVPNFEPFAGGETIYQGIASTLLPRFIYETKSSSGGVKNFERFTGHKLQPGTSMNLSVIGEAYANFGTRGSILFMFIFGLFLNLVYSTIIKKTIKIPSLLFFLPLIFLQVIKAETDFVTVLNHLIKASIFVALLYFGFRKILGINL